MRCAGDDSASRRFYSEQDLAYPTAIPQHEYVHFNIFNIGFNYASCILMCTNYITIRFIYILYIEIIDLRVDHCLANISDIYYSRLMLGPAFFISNFQFASLYPVSSSEISLLTISTYLDLRLVWVLECMGWLYHFPHNQFFSPEPTYL